jgi:hypothetical protein
MGEAYAPAWQATIGLTYKFGTGLLSTGPIGSGARVGARANWRSNRDDNSETEACRPE